MRIAPRQESSLDGTARETVAVGAVERLGRARGRSRWWWVLAVLLVGLLLRNYDLQYLRQIEFKEAFLTNLALLLSFVGFLFWMRGRPVWPRPMLESRWQIAALLAVVLIGAWARSYRFDVYPPEDGQLWEESQLGAGGYASSQGQGLDNFFPLPTLTAETGFRLLGVSMHTLRIPFRVLGIASIVVFFLAARLFFKTYLAAWFATALFATSALLAAVGRIALETMSPIFTECVALAALFYACTKRDYAAFALAGFANGLLMTEYFSYKIVPVYAGLLLVTILFQAPAPYCNAGRRIVGARGWSRASPLLLVALGFGLAVILPVLLSDPGQPLMPFVEGFARHKAALTDRAASESIQQVLTDLYGRVRLVATYLFIGGGGADLLPVTLGAIDYYTGVLGVVALAYCALFAWRSPAKLFLTVAIVLTVVLSGALVQNPMRYRLIPLVPIWFLAVGTLLDDLGDRFPRHHRVLAAMAVALLVGVAGVNFRNLFVVALHDRDVAVNFYDLNVLMAKEIASLQRGDPGATVYLLSRREHLAYINDYYFLYDHDHVRVVSSVDKLEQAHGYLLADNEFVEPAAAYPRAKDCRHWRTDNNRDRLVSCRLE